MWVSETGSRRRTGESSEGRATGLQTPVGILEESGPALARVSDFFFQEMTEISIFFNVKYPGFSILITNSDFKKHSGPNKIYLSSFSAQPHSQPVWGLWFLRSFTKEQLSAHCALGRRWRVSEMIQIAIKVRPVTKGSRFSRQKRVTDKCWGIQEEKILILMWKGVWELTLGKHL